MARATARSNVDAPGDAPHRMPASARPSGRHRALSPKAAEPCALFLRTENDAKNRQKAAKMRPNSYLQIVRKKKKMDNTTLNCFEANPALRRTWPCGRTERAAFRPPRRAVAPNNQVKTAPPDSERAAKKKDVTSQSSRFVFGPRLPAARLLSRPPERKEGELTGRSAASAKLHRRCSR